ncbi:ECF-type riboflavin transporter substrate-binding protein [Carnimonas bestiolae]|uniref:ECF-type riboflavin transporter substrate-binding protein n=1 Tax=Carnimonas bestiolae TaxID=3402172 RepID=UPI003EDC2863
MPSFLNPFARRPLSVTDVVAIGIGTAIFYILMRFVMVPSPLPNTSIALCYPFLALLGVAFGPVVAGLAGLCGHCLNDLTLYGSVWISWVLVSGVVGALFGLLQRPLAIADGRFSKPKLLLFSLAALVINVLSWGALAPLLDQLIYAEPAARVFTQGVLSALVNSLTTVIVGVPLLTSWAASFVPRGTLVKPQAQRNDIAIAPLISPPHHGGDVVVSADQFSWTYTAQQAPSLNLITLHIRQGEKVAIIGSSGSGKSTLLKSLNGTLPHLQSGTADGRLRIAESTFGEASVAQLSLQAGTALQDSNTQFVGLTVAEDIAFALENSACPQARMQREVVQWAQRLGITELLERAPHQLSGGQQQRVALAGVLIDQPQLLLLDEPLAALDPTAAAQAIELIDELHRQHQLTTVIIEHRLETLLHRSLDRVVLLDHGRVVADTDPDTLLRSGLLPHYGIREPRWIEVLRHYAIALPDSGPLRPEALPNEAKARLLERSSAPPSPSSATPSGSLSVAASPRSPSSSSQHTTPPVPPSGLLSTAPLLAMKGVGYHHANSDGAGVHHIDLALHAGERVSLVGANGAGKSTLANLLCGFLRPHCGTIEWQGRSMAGESIKHIGERIGYVMQDANQMLGAATVYREAAWALELRGWGAEDVERRVRETLRICGLDEVRHWPLAALSHGQKKRLSIAAVLVTRPPVLLLDEPTSGQDYQHARELMTFLDQLNQRGHTLVMVTHDMDLLLEHSDRTLVLRDGAIIADGAPAEVLADPAIVAQGALRRSSLYQLADVLNPHDRRWAAQCVASWLRDASTQSFAEQRSAGGGHE